MSTGSTMTAMIMITVMVLDINAVGVKRYLMDQQKEGTVYER